MTIGQTTLGVRTNLRDVNERVERLLPSHHLTGSEGVDPNFSLLYGQQPTIGKAVHNFARRGAGRLRTTSPGRMIRALLQHLSDFALPERTGVAKIEANALVRADEAVLVHPGVIGNLYRTERRLNRLGWRLVDVNHADVDLATGQFCPRPSQLEIDPVEWVGLENLYPSASNEVAIDRPLSFTIRAWLVPGDQILASLPDTPARLPLSLSRQVAPEQGLPISDAIGVANLLLELGTAVHVIERRNDRATAEAALAEL